MSELRKCPFCGGRSRTVRGVDLAGEKVLGFFVKHDRSKWCPITHSSVKLFETCEDAIEAWNRRTPDAGITATENTPLTLEELRGMDGEPVWIVQWPDWGHWELSADAEDYLEDRDEDFYGMTMPPTMPDPMGRYGLHVMGWLAYRQKPVAKEEAE